MIGDDSGHLVWALSAAVDVVVVCAAIRWAGRGDPIGRRLIEALGVASLLLAAKGGAMLAAGLEIPFGVLHVVWLDLVVVTPLAGLWLLMTAWRRIGPVLRAIALAALLLAPLGAYASFVEPARLELERAELTLPEERAGNRPLRVGVIADLQFQDMGDHEREAVDRVLAERPDVILLAGDYYQGWRADFKHELPGIRALLRQLRAPGGVYAVQGDTDSLWGLRHMFPGTGVTLLLNDVARTRIGDRRITIGGVELHRHSPQARAIHTRLERAPAAGDVRILLSHRPDAVLDLSPDSRVDLVVAGHTHGGQLQLPLIGPLVTASDVPREVAGGGLHRVGGNWIYVSRGVGVERAQAPRLRLGAPPEVSLLTLR